MCHHLPVVHMELKLRLCEDYQQNCLLPVNKLHCTGFHKKYFVLLEGRSLPLNSSYLEVVADSEITHSDPYMDCVPTLWSPTNFIT